MSLTRRRCQKRNVQWGKSGKRRVIFFLLIDSKSTLLPLNLLPFTEPALLPLNLPLLLSLSRAAQLLTDATSLHWVHGLTQHAWANHGNRRTKLSCCKLVWFWRRFWARCHAFEVIISTGELYWILVVFGYLNLDPRTVGSCLLFSLYYSHYLVVLSLWTILLPLHC